MIRRTFRSLLFFHGYSARRDRVNKGKRQSQQEIANQ
jgi:hypothetical protein